MNSITKELDKVKEISDMVLYNADGYATLPNEEVNLLIAIANQALQRLEEIDNAEPSEAWKIVYNNFDYLISDVGIENDDVNICLKTIKEQLPTIKQALIKAQIEHKALEVLKQNVKVIIDYGGKYTISMALVFYIDNKKTIYVVDEAIKEQSPEHFKNLELLKEVLEK